MDYIALRPLRETLRALRLIFFTTSLQAIIFFLLLKITKYAVVYKQPEIELIPATHEENEVIFSGLEYNKMLIKNLEDE